MDRPKVGTSPGDGRWSPYVLAVEPNTVTRLRTTERDGYTAVQLGTDVDARS